MKKRLLLISLALLAVVSTVFADDVIITYYADGAVVKRDTTPESSLETYAIKNLSVTGCRGYNFVGWKKGNPVEDDEEFTPLVTGDLIAPRANISLYAVYQKDENVAPRYIRITSTAELKPGKYVIVCYYEWDGDTYYGPSYYALGNAENPAEVQSANLEYVYTEGNYDYYAIKYHISASPVPTNAGVITDPATAIQWTLSGSENAWKWTNGSVSLNFGTGAYLLAQVYDGDIIDYNYPENHILANPGNTCSITASNGAFNFESGGYYLTYSDDEEDYFKMGIRNNWTFYLYKEEPEYTSYPNCSNWTVHLDALSGIIDGTDPDTTKTDVFETSSELGASLPDATISNDACSSWRFAGWHAESPIQGTTQQPTFCANPYFPSYNGSTLYAVYQVGEDATYYLKINDASELNNGDTCLIVYTGNSNAVTYNNTNNSWTGTPMTIIGETRINEVPANAKVEWTYNSSRNCFYNVSSRTYQLAYVGRKTYPYLLTANGTSFKLQYYYSGTYYYIRWNNGFEDGTNSNNTFHIYKKVTTYATYSSYPACVPFEVKLNACGGLINGEQQITRYTDPEHNIYSITISDATPRCPDYGWEFVGWQEGGDVESVKDVEYTGLYKGSYAPSRNGVTLYAVYKRKLNTFRILYSLSAMVGGDNYVITGYYSYLDWEISSKPYNNTNYLSVVKAASPQGEAGYTIEAKSDSVIWTMNTTGTYNNCTFRNLANNLYLSSNNSGNTATANPGNSYSFSEDNSGFKWYMRDRNNNNRYLYLNYNNGNPYFSTINTNNTNQIPAMYVYRQMKEFTSWPHCDPFTVNFDACGGTLLADSLYLTEKNAYDGVILPEAAVNSDCGKEGWEFLGWATDSISEESNTLPLDIMPAGTMYNPPVNNGTLYAVYQQKTGTFKRISSMTDLRLGLDYIIATSGDSAMSNTAHNTNFVASKKVNPQSNIITSDDAAIEWRIQGARGAYEFYNAARNVYLDLSTSGYALLSQDSAVDNFVITVSSGSFKIRSIQALTNTKYLGFTSPHFNTVLEGKQPPIYLYQQQALYHSNPNCVEAVDALRWDFENDSNYVYVESYLLAGLPNMHGSIGTPKECFNADTTEGPIKIKYSTAEVAPGTKTTIQWGGTRSKLMIPYVAFKDTSSSALLATATTESDVVVLDGATLTINADKSIHNLTLYEGSTLDVSNGSTLTVNSLILRCEDDQKMPTVNLNSTGEISLNNDAIYFDARIDEERYYWFSLPFDAKLQEISYSNLEANGGAPTYRSDFWVKYYDGVRRVNDINNSCYTGNATGSKYWTHLAAKDTLKAGQGYIVGIADQKHITQEDGRKHTKRVMRFTLKAESGWLDAERVGGSSSKTTTVVPSVTNDPRNMAHAGWNLIGNPYMHAYKAESEEGGSGLRVGAWEKDNDGWYVLDEDSLQNVPYLTKYIYDETESKWKYVQRLASNTTLHPFEAVFVQINEGNAINFASLTHYIPSNAPAYLRNAAYEEDTPFRTGVVLSGAGKTDATGVVLAAEYSPAYEIGADLMKMLNSKALNLYTLNADNQELAFNGLSEENAMDPIPVGVIFPSAGTYTFAFDASQYSMDGLESLVLIDKVAGTQTELLHFEYDFTIDGAATINNRFELLVRRAHKVPTDISFTSEEDQEVFARKFIREGKLFIIRDNKIYDATGTRVQ